MSASCAALWDSFTAKAELVGAVVEWAPSDEAAAVLLADRAPRGLAGTAGLAARFPRVAAGAAPPPEPDAAAPDVVAAGRFAVAETGSVLVCEPTRDRAACFLAEHLWLMVAADQVVPTLEAAFEQLGAAIRAGARHAVFMTGPSRSADIERTLTVGVHGPRRLTIVVVGERP